MNSPLSLTPKALDQAPPGSSVRTCILVLGMHRSGTSAMTRTLSIAGAKLPASLMGAGKGNEVGHWESDDLLQFHDQLLEELGSTWQDWRALKVGHLPVERRRDIKVEIRDLLAAEFGDATLFVVKDPRMCRFAPLFLDALDDAGIGPRIVHIIRNPLEVAESLERRDGLLRTDAALQWLRHVLDSEAATRSRSRVIISYAALLTDWRAAFDSITEALQVAWPYSTDEIAEQVGQFLDRAHRHHTHTTEDVVLDTTMRDWIGEAYSALLVLEQSPDSKPAMTTLDTIRREFDHAAPILHLLQADARRAFDKNLDRLRAEISQANAETERLTATLAERDQELSNRKAALAESDKQVAELDAAVGKKNAETEELARALAERDQELSSRKAALAESDKQVTELGAAVDKKNAETEELARALAEREEEGAALKVALNDAEKTATDAKSLAEQHHQHLRRVEREQKVLLQQANCSRQELIDHFLSSTSWKLTRPLRVLKQFLFNSTFFSNRPKQLFKAKKIPDDDASTIMKSGGALATVSIPATKLQHKPTGQKVACLVHIYYPEIWPSIYQYVRKLDCVNCDVFINITNTIWSEELHAQVRHDVPDASIVVSENRGRDIGGHLNCLSGIHIDNYAAFFLMHTKKSKHLSERHSENWRSELLDPILGTTEKVADNLALMNSDPEIGIIGAAAWRHQGVDNNSRNYEYLLRKFAIERAHASCDYVSGTMMIVKPKIIKRMYEVLSKVEFENADGKDVDWLRDGQLEHAVERLFGNVCKSLGCRIHWS